MEQLKDAAAAGGVDAAEREGIAGLRATIALAPIGNTLQVAVPVGERTFADEY